MGNDRQKMKALMDANEAYRGELNKLKAELVALKFAHQKLDMRVFDIEQTAVREQEEEPVTTEEKTAQFDDLAKEPAKGEDRIEEKRDILSTYPLPETKPEEPEQEEPVTNE